MATEMGSIPPPGSDEAIDLGCNCPVFDNAYGLGYLGGVKDPDGGTVYVVRGDCPVHAKPTHLVELEDEDEADDGNERE